MAHPGRTAADGCHYCRTNCDKWGVAWNERHCHGGGSDAPAYIVTPSTPVPTPRPTIKPTPVKTNVPSISPPPQAQFVPNSDAQVASSSLTQDEQEPSASDWIITASLLGGLGAFVYKSIKSRR